MAFSTFRKAAPRRTHHERSQPASRAKLGFLEKHKDYVVRAKNFHFKQKRILALQEKARLKNPDEFYFSMKNQKMVNGNFVSTEKPKTDDGKVITDDMIRLMKNQDRVYLRTMRQILERRINRETAVEGTRRHVVYGEQDEELVEEYNEETEKDTEAGRQEENLSKLVLMERKLNIERNLTESKGRRLKVGEDALGLPVYKWNHQRLK